MKPRTPISRHAYLKRGKPPTRKVAVKQVNEKRGGHRFPGNVNEPLRNYIRVQKCRVPEWAQSECRYAHKWVTVDGVRLRCLASDVAHVTTRGSGCPDENGSVSLCRWHHVLAPIHQEGNTAAFEAHYGMDLQAIAEEQTAAFHELEEQEL